MGTVLVYSDDPAIRERVQLAVGRRPDPELGAIDWVEAGDAPSVTRLVDAGGIDGGVLGGGGDPRLLARRRGSTHRRHGHLPVAEERGPRLSADAAAGGAPGRSVARSL